MTDLTRFFDAQLEKKKAMEEANGAVNKKNQQALHGGEVSKAARIEQSRKQPASKGADR